jgi:hypothetical protein
MQKSVSIHEQQTSPTARQPFSSALQCSTNRFLGESVSVDEKSEKFGLFR